MDRQMRKAIFFSLVLVALSGCQGPLPGIGGLSQPGRVPPPPTGSYQVPGTYSGGTGANPTVGSVPNGVPFVDQVAAAQNQLKQATDSARAAVMQSTQNLQSQVDQASARADKMGAGVVQASQILSDAAMGSLPPIPPAMPAASGTTGSSLPAQSPPGLPGASGSLADEGSPQWRKPTPR